MLLVLLLLLIPGAFIIHDLALDQSLSLNYVGYYILKLMLVIWDHLLMNCADCPDTHKFDYSAFLFP